MARQADAQGSRVARNGLSIAAARTLAAAASMVALPVLYTHLGARRFGVWSVLTAAVAIAGFADMGLGSHQVREVTRTLAGGCARKARAALGLGVLWAVGSGTLLWTGALVCWPWLFRTLSLGESAEAAHDALLLLLAGLVLDGVATTWQAILEGAQCYAALAWVTCVVVLCGTTSALLVATCGGGLVMLAGGMAATSVARVVLTMVTARRHVPALSPDLRHIRRDDVSALTGYGVRVQVSNAASAVNDRTDRLVLAGFTSPLTVGAFDLGSRLANTLRMLPVSLLMVLFPAAIRTREASTDQLDRLYHLATRYLAVYAAVTAAALETSADPLVRLWVGHRIPLATTTIVVLSIGYAVNSTAGPAAVVTRSEGQPGRETRFVLLAALLNILLTVPLLELLGPVGVPLSTTLAAVAGTMYFFVHFHRRSQRPLKPVIRMLWPPAAAATTASVFTWAVAPGLPDGPGRLGAAVALLSRGLVATIVVMAALIALGFFDRTDRDRLQAAMGRLLSRRTTTTARDQKGS